MRIAASAPTFHAKEKGLYKGILRRLEVICAFFRSG